MATDNNLESYMGGVDDSNMNKSQATNDFHYIPAPLKVNVKPVDTGNGKTAGGKDYQEALKQYNDLAATNELPKFRISNGRVKLSGNAKYVNSDIVNSASTMLRDYFKGADLTNAQNAENLQKALDEVNEQIASQLRYQEYADFLDKTGFSDAAYRNYALARTEADPTTTTNLMNSTKKFSGYDKDGNLLTGNDAKTPAEWFTYWKENFTPEERLKLWIDSMDALSRAENDEDLYRGLPYILMGVKETENVPARIMNTVNPFDEEGWGAGDGNKAKERASVNVPIYGFEDVSQPDVFWDSFWSTNKEAFGRLIGFVGSQTDPLARFLGPKYVTGGANTPEEWGSTNGIEGVTYETIGNISKEDWDRFADIVNEFWGTKNPERLSGKSDAEILIEKYGKDDAAKIMLVRDFSTLPSTQGREEGYKAYQKYQEYAELQSSEGYKSPYEKWGREFESEMQQHLSRLGTLAPSSSTFGVISGTIARIMAEQAALSYISGGSLSAAKIAENLTRGGWKLVGKALDKIGVGQYVFSKAPALAKAVAGLANGSAEGLAGASKAIYVTGAIGTWAVREMGEDVLRGLVDDMVTANSFDSQGNLDPNKLIENIYMNALMYGMAKGVGGAFKGLAGIVDNAKTRNIDGVELNATQQRQLRLLQSALDDQNSRVIFRGFDDDGHPVVTNRGITHTLDELTASGDTMKQINDATGAAAPTTLRTVEDILADEEISETTREKIAEVARDKDLDTSKPGWEDDVKTKLQEKLTDDEIREAFPDGVIKIGDETVRISTKDFTAGDVGRVGGLDFKTIDDAIVALKQATAVRDFTNAVNGVMRTAKYFAENFKRAVEEFAQANNMSIRDVMVEIRNSRIAGQETIPGLKELWDTYWRPTQDALLDIQEARTGIRPVSHDFYFRDMIEGTFKPSDSGAWSIDNSTTADILGGDSTFDLTASSTAKNTGKLGELAADKLEYDPEVLAREFVASRLQTIWASDDMGKTFAAMQEAHDAGEFDFTEADAAKSIEATEQVAGDVENSAGVKEIQNLVNVEKLDEGFGPDRALSAEEISAKEARAKELDNDIKGMEEQLARDKQDLEDVSPKTDAHETVTKLDYETRQRLAENFVKKNPDYILAYRNQGTGIDDWYSNGTGAKGTGDPTRFETYGSDKGDLTNAVWLTTDKEWAEGVEKSSAGTNNGAPEHTIVIPIKKSLIVDGNGEFPSYRPDLGEADMSRYGTPYYSLRRFSELNDNKIVLTRSTQKIEWEEARDARIAAKEQEIVSPAMRNRLNPSFYNRTELVLFKDAQPDVLKDGEEAILGEYNLENKSSSRRIRSAEQNVVNSEKILSDMQAEKAQLENEISAAKIKEVSDTPAEDVTVKQVEAAAEASKAQAVTAQKAFNNSASKSNAAELISKNSGYRNRATRVNPGPVVGVNYMPGDPFKRFSGWVNDHFVKANSIKTTFSGYKADGSPVSMSITAYNGGYKMFAEAGSFARNVIVDIQNGSTLWDAVYKQVYENGFFIEPSKSQRAKYGALTVREQAAKATDRIMDRMNKDARFSHAFADDGTVKDTAALISMLTTRFRGQGINDFSKFLRKANWDSFTKGEQKWLNKRMYEMTASSNAKTKKLTIDGIMRASMGLRYRSNMWFNFKNGQLQLTECQRLFTMNKVGDFGSTLKRLVTDSDYRQKVSDYTYILASESAGAGFSKSDLENATDAAIKLGSESTISKNGIMTDIDKVKAKFKDFDDAALASVEGGEYAKNYILIAGFVAAGEKQGLDGAQLDVYVRNRFNTEALAGTNVGKIGLTDSTIGQFAFMYLGFPIRDLTLQWHMLRGGGIRGDVRGSLEYLAKVLGAKGAVWAMEAPWGYSLMDQIGLDPFGLAEQYDQMPNDYQERDPFWRLVDEFGVRYNPFMQGAMTSAFADVYFSYRAAQEAAREEYKEAHNGSTEGFEWSLADAGGEMWTELVKGITPGYTAASRVSGELQDLDRGYHISQSGSRIYETNTDLGNVGWGLLTGRRNTANAQDYYQTANPIRGMVENGLPGLGQQLERAIPVKVDQLLAGKNPFRGFREFDPIDSETYEDWFDGSYQDQQNWNTGIYAFQEEAQEIGDRYDKYAQTGTAVNDMNARENELSDLRKRVELYVQAYTDKHPEGISAKKQNQIINIFNLGEYQPTLQEAFQEAQGNIDMTDWDAAQNRYSRGNFPTAYGLTQNKDLENDYAQSPQLQDVLSRQRYGVNSEAAPMIDQMFNSQSFDTPLGNMTMKDYHDAVYAQLEDEWNKSKPDYEKITRLQEAYLDEVSKNVIQPILNTYGSSVLSAGRSSEIVQEFGKMLNGMIPSDQYRIDKKGRKIYQSTPYMTVDIPKWMRANFKAYEESVDKTDRQASRRLDDIRRNLDAGRTSTAKSYARALIQDIGSGKVSVSRDELEWLQGVLND